MKLVVATAPNFRPAIQVFNESSFRSVNVEVFIGSFNLCCLTF